MDRTVVKHRKLDRYRVQRFLSSILQRLASSQVGVADYLLGIKVSKQQFAAVSGQEIPGKTLKVLPEYGS